MNKKGFTLQEAYTQLNTLRLLKESFFGLNSDYAPAAGGTINCNATPATSDSGIEDELPAFKPGGCTGCASLFGLLFTYQIIKNLAQTLPVAVPYVVGAGTAAQTPCFIAVATGVAGLSVEGDVFAIDCNNIQNF